MGGGGYGYFPGFETIVIMISARLRLLNVEERNNDIVARASGEKDKEEEVTYFSYTSFWSQMM